MALFDINTGGFIFGDDDYGFDTDGHMFHKTGDNTVMDMTTGEIHFTSGSNDPSDERRD